MGKDWIKQALTATGAMRLAARFNDRGAVILMYHSVRDEPQRAARTLGGISHSTQVFRGQMELIARKYSPVSLGDVLRFVREEKDLPVRPVAVTFDDGYADNHEVAMPILNHVGVPAAFYVTVDCVENKKPPWPARLRYAFHETTKMIWRETGSQTWELKTAAQRESAYLKACDECCQLSGDAQERFVAGIEMELSPAIPETDRPRMMTWDHVRALAKAGHLMGSHTMTHPNMAYLGEQDLRREFAESKRKLEEVLNSPVIHFSYPCPALSPHWTERTVEMSRQIAYQTAVTADGGLVRRRDNPLCLRRIRPTKEVSGLRWNLECAFVGRAM